MNEVDAIRQENITIKELLHEGDHSSVFLVQLQDLQCVMKLVRPSRTPSLHSLHSHTYRNQFHTFMSLDMDDDGEVLNIYRLEKKAYPRLEASGVCDAGTIPHCYGYLEEIDVLAFDLNIWRKAFSCFRYDEFRPNALFIEYIPGMKMMDLETYTKERFAKIVTGLGKIHAAHVLHGDPMPRNMMVVPETERVLWIDRAKTFDSDTVTTREQKQLDLEMSIVTLLEDKLVRRDTLQILDND